MRLSYVVGKHLQSAGDRTYGGWALLSIATQMVEFRRRSSDADGQAFFWLRGVPHLWVGSHGRDTKSKLVDQAEWRRNETCLRNRTAKVINVVKLV